MFAVDFAVIYGQALFGCWCTVCTPRTCASIMPSPCPVCRKQYVRLDRHLRDATDQAHSEWRRTKEQERLHSVFRARGAVVTRSLLVVAGNKRRSAAQQPVARGSTKVSSAAARSAERKKKKSKLVVAQQLQTTTARVENATTASVRSGNTRSSAPTIDDSDSNGDNIVVVGVVGRGTAVVHDDATAAVGEAAHTAAVICVTDDDGAGDHSPRAVPAVVDGGVADAELESDVIVVDRCVDGDGSETTGSANNVSLVLAAHRRLKPKAKKLVQGKLSFARAETAPSTEQQRRPAAAPASTEPPRPAAASASTGRTPASNLPRQDSWTVGRYQNRHYFFESPGNGKRFETELDAMVHGLRCGTPFHGRVPGSAGAIANANEARRLVGDSVTATRTYCSW